MNSKRAAYIKIFIFILGFCFLLYPDRDMDKVCAARISLNKSKVTITKGNTYTLKLNNTKKRAKWSSNNKKVATVNSKGKVNAKAKGRAIITARIGGKRYKCTVIVKDSAYAMNSKEKEIVAFVNRERKKQGRDSLQTDEKLQKAADKRAKEIATRFSHVRPNGTMCDSVLDEYYISYSSTGENIAAGYPSAKNTMKQWMSSSGHRSNILNSKFKKIGVGYYKSSTAPYQYYWVQIFTD